MRIWKLALAVSICVVNLQADAQQTPANVAGREQLLMVTDPRIDAILRDQNGLLRHFRYQDHLENAEKYGIRDSTPQGLADTYLRQRAEALSIPSAWLTLDKFIPSGMSDAPSRIQSAEVKSLGNTFAVSYVQSKFGLQVWQSGIALTMIGGKNPYVVSVTSSVEPAIEIEKPQGNLQFPTKRPTEAELARVLGVDPTQPRVDSARLLIYRYRKADRTLPPANEDPGVAIARIAIPGFPLPAVPDEIAEDEYRVVNDVGFTTPTETIGDVKWRAFIDIKTGAVLYLRSAVQFATGRVFPTDPISISGNASLTPNAAAADLNPLRSPLLTLDDLDSPVAGQQSLAGKYVVVKDTCRPVAAPPTAATPFEFDYSVNTDNFAAVSAYYHCNATFRLMESFGIDLKVLFSGTTFPVPVDHRAIGDVVNAMVDHNDSSNGVKGFLFGRAKAGSTLSMCADRRAVLHEFCHGILWNSIHWGCVAFGEGCGDSLAAIMSAPDSKAPDPFMTVPWAHPERRHDRLVSQGWCWDGGTHCTDEYSREQILSTSLFRLYQVTGGDASSPATRTLAARTTSNLLVRGLGLLNPYTPTTNPESLESTMIAADKGTTSLDGVPGGAMHKVVRWTFAKQGLHRPASQPVNTEGGPPAVDVYIDDGRNGDYWPYLKDWTKTNDIWNRLCPDGINGHQTPARFQPNYIYVRVKNRGTQMAKDVSVRVYNRVPGTTATWPGGMRVVTTAVLPAAGAPSITIPPGGTVVVGPFTWCPACDEDQLLATVSASGDLSNIDPSSPLPVNAGPTALDRFVPFDNNIAVLAVNPAVYYEYTRPRTRSRARRAFGPRWVTMP